mmetsp:Transcript_48110/g.79730  ORF Transcript_48110/g.79730 Transcript_48110/m.79730 type:complete len:417 (-) Transcript_48110:79-1329(-)
MKELNEKALPENYPIQVWVWHMLSFPDISHVATYGGKVIGYVLGCIRPVASPQPAPASTSTSSASSSSSNPERVSRNATSCASAEPKAVNWEWEGHVTSLAVDPSFQKLGIATSLMKLAMFEMRRAHNCSVCKLHVREHTNPAAVKLYQHHLAFDCTNITKAYYDDNENALCMEKDLRYIRNYENLLSHRFQEKEHRHVQGQKEETDRTTKAGRSDDKKSGEGNAAEEVRETRQPEGEYGLSNRLHSMKLSQHGEKEKSRLEGGLMVKQSSIEAAAKTDRIDKEDKGEDKQTARIGNMAHRGNTTQNQPLEEEKKDNGGSSTTTSSISPCGSSSSSSSSSIVATWKRAINCQFQAILSDYMHTATGPNQAARSQIFQEVKEIVGAGEVDRYGYAWMTRPKDDKSGESITELVPKPF